VNDVIVILVLLQTVHRLLSALAATRSHYIDGRNVKQLLPSRAQQRTVDHICYSNVHVHKPKQVRIQLCNYHAIS
jgi:hypothetical protein